MKKVFLSLVVIFSAIFTLNAQTADEIIAKYITAIGGAEKWSKIQSLIVEGQMEVQGIAIPFTMQGVHMKGNRVDAEFQGNKIIDITTPTKGWSQNPFGGKMSLDPISDEELKSKVDDLDLQDAFIDYKAKGSTVEFLGKDEEDGNEYFKIKITSKNNNDKTYFFDTKTYLAYKVESMTKQQGQDVKSVIKLLDYQTIDFGIKMSFKSDMGQMMMVTKKVTVNPAIDETIFKGN
jgi:hypothetical protein